MSLQMRFQAILADQNCKQKDLAATLKVSESYISNLLNGKRTVLSNSLAALIEEIYGYSARWILTGEEPMISNMPQLSSAAVRNRIIEEISAMSDAELNAVLAFTRSLSSIKNSLNNSK